MVSQIAIGWVESAIETKNAQPSCFLFSTCLHLHAFSHCMGFLGNQHAINNCQNGQTFRTVISFTGKHLDQLLWINDVWRIIPDSKWLENPIYKPFKEGVPRPQVLGTTPITMIINHLAPRNLQLEEAPLLSGQVGSRWVTICPPIKGVK